MSIVSCLNPPPDIGLLEIFMCVGELVFGSLQLAAIAFFIIILYLMWSLNVPKEAALPISIGFLFVLLAWFYMSAILSFMFLAIIGVAVLLLFGILNFLRR